MNLFQIRIKNLKRIIIGIILMCTFVFNPNLNNFQVLSNIYADTSVSSSQKYGIINVKSASFRSGAGSSYKLYSKLKQNDKVTILNYRGSWIKIKYNNKIGYVYYKYLTIMKEKNTTSKSLNFRSGPGTKYSIKGKISKNSKVYVIWEGSSWSKVYYKGNIGYISNKYLTNNIRICIDAGHQTVGDTKNTEPIGPGSSIRKFKVSWGTAGSFTKIPEYEVNLLASKSLQKILESRGYDVIMTRDINNVYMSNVQRAEFANMNNVDLVVRIHADSNSSSSIKGASILIPDKNSKYTKVIYPNSYKVGNYIRKELKKNNITMFGQEIYERSDLTGFNWSKIPSVLLEMGFMSNKTDDYNLTKSSYRKSLMTYLANGIDDYFGK